MNLIMGKSKKIKKSIPETQVKINQKDSYGLFDGSYKSVEFESKKHKQNRHNNRKNIKDYNDYD